MTTVDINGVIGATTVPAFRISGTRTHVGEAAEGLLINMRTATAIFDDMNSGTYAKWRYPGGGTYGPDRQTTEFCNALPDYKAAGVDAVTISLMGALADPAASGPPWSWDSCAFNTDGTRPTSGARAGFWSRLEQALAALDAQGMVAIVQLLYQNEMNRLANAAAVNTAADAWVDWILSKTYRNVLFSIGNEVDSSQYTFSVDTDGGREALMDRMRARLVAGGWTSPLVGVTYGSTAGSSYPSNAVIAHADWVGFSNNSNTTGNITTRLTAIRGFANYISNPVPILVVEDNSLEYVGLTDRFATAVTNHASTGLYLQGSAGSFAGGDYQTGFQSVPTPWGLLDGNGGLTGSAEALKAAWFSWVTSVTGGAPPPPPPPPPTSAGITVQWETSASGAHGSWSDESPETALTLDLKSGDATTWKRARMIAANSFGTTNEWTPRVGPIQAGGAIPTLTTPPAVTGTTITGSTLTTSEGVWGGDPSTRTAAWQRSLDAGASWTDIPAAAGSFTYVLVNPTDVDAIIRSQITATNSSGSTVAYSAATSTVTIPTTFPNLTLSVSLE